MCEGLPQDKIVKNIKVQNRPKYNLTRIPIIEKKPIL